MHDSSIIRDKDDSAKSTYSADLEEVTFSFYVYCTLALVRYIKGGGVVRRGVSSEKAWVYYNTSPCLPCVT